MLAPPPSWVVERPAAPIAAAEEGLAFRIRSLDTQVRLEGESQHVFTAMRLEILTTQGLSEGNVAMAWRPETEQLTVHKVLIRRGGQVIDVLASGQEFTTMRREQNLEQAMLDGMITASLFPDDLQVGDTVEIASTRTVRNPVTGEHNEVMVGPLNFVLGQLDVVLSWPVGKPIRISRSDDLPEWKRTRKGGYEFAEISLANLQPVLPPRDAPVRFSLARIGEASDYASWAEVAHLFVPLYADASQIPATGSLRDQVEKIRTTTEDPIARAELALALVQGRVRYVALLSGLGGLVPAGSAETWARRYGDCKAKTALLIGILDELGIEAEPVLVNSQFGSILESRLPAVGLFNHVIVRAVIDGRDYWLDGTRTGDTSLARLEIPYFSWGLPLREGDVGLVRMVPEPLALPEEDVAIEFDARQGLYGAVPARIEVVLRGDSAIATNQLLSQLAGEVRDRTLREFWRGRFHFVEPTTMQSQFDSATGELRLTLVGTATMEWDDGWYATDYTRVGYRADFSRNAGPQSDAPFEVGYPSYDRSQQVILLPASFTKDAISGDTEIDETVAAVHYYRTAKLEDGRFTIVRSYRSVAPEFPAAEAAAAQQRLRDLYDKRVHLRVPNNYRPTDADLKFARTSPDAKASNLFELGRRMLSSGRTAEAAELFTKATAQDPKDEWSWANLAIALAYQGDFARSEEAAARAEALSPGNYVVWNARGLVALRREQNDEAVAAFSKAIESKNDNSWAYSQRAGAFLALKYFEAGLADARRAVELAPDDAMAYSKAVIALKQLGRNEEAEKSIAGLLERYPDAEWAKALASELFLTLNLDDQAKSVMDSAQTATALTFQASRRDPLEADLVIADLNKALALDPKFVPALVLRAKTHWREYNFKQAIADADAAIALDPNAFQAYDVKAQSLIELGRTADAAKVVDRLVEVAQNDPMALANAAQIYQQIGYRTKAKEIIKRAKEIAPDHPFIKAISSQIGS